MIILFLLLIMIASVALGFVVLVQNPKGGGLSGSLGGFSNQLMGVKQTTDVLEKGTWIFASVIAVLCLLSTFFLNGSTGGGAPASDVRGAAVPASQGAQPVSPSTPNPKPNAVPFNAGR